jgi:hypothetical protein
MAVIGAAVALSGCAAIFDGTTQQIAVNTTPSDAQCKFMRNGGVIADISSTPSAVTIQKTKHNISIVCSKPGYEDATFINKSGVAGATFANILGGVITGGVAWAIDSGSGADNKYESQVNMSLVPSAFVPVPPPLATAAPRPTAAPTTDARVAPAASVPAATVPAAAGSSSTEPAQTVPPPVTGQSRSRL